MTKSLLALGLPALLTLLPFVIAAVSTPAPRPSGPTGSRAAAAWLLVVDKTSKELLFIDPMTHAVAARVPTGDGPNPHEVAVTPDGRWAFVAVYAAGGGVYGSVIQVVDVRSRKEVGRIDLGEFRGPHGLAVTKDGQRLYATVEASKALLEISIPGRKVTRSFPTGQDISHMVTLTADESKAYVANIRSGTVTVIDLKSGSARNITTGAGAEGIGTRPRSHEVWATNRAADTVSVIDTRTDTVTKTIECGKFPIRVAFSPDGATAYVSCANSNEIAVINAATKREEARINVGRMPIGLLVAPGGDRLYAANTSDGTVTILDLKTRRVTGQIAAGKEPDGMAYCFQ